MAYLVGYTTKTFYNSTVYSSLNKNDLKKTSKKIKKRKKHIKYHTDCQMYLINAAIE